MIRVMVLCPSLTMSCTLACDDELLWMLETLATPLLSISLVTCSSRPLGPIRQGSLAMTSNRPFPVLLLMAMIVCTATDL